MWAQYWFKLEMCPYQDLLVTFIILTFFYIIVQRGKNESSFIHGNDG